MAQRQRHRTKRSGAHWHGRLLSPEVAFREESDQRGGGQALHLKYRPSAPEVEGSGVANFYLRNMPSALASAVALRLSGEHDGMRGDGCQGGCGRSAPMLEGTPENKSLVSLTKPSPLGSETETEMKIFKTTLAGAALVAMTAGGAAPAMAYLHLGSETRYPSSGGTWKYGFWDAKVRSYYTVNQNHGSSVIYNGDLTRSICTASGQTSVATDYAINTPGATDEYYYRTC